MGLQVKPSPALWHADCSLNDEQSREGGMSCIAGLLILALVADLVGFGGLAEVLFSLAGIVAMAVLLFALSRRELDPRK
jgi:uncharacterized membrane protein YtjA (UPF0391 family)